MAHSGAAFANAAEFGAQGGYVEDAARADMLSDLSANWSPWVRRSYRLRRVDRTP